MRFFKHSGSKNTASKKIQNAVLVTAMISLLVACVGIWAINEAHNLQIENMTASNLASEGIEAFRTIRNTNWIKYRENPEKCWLTLPQSNVCNADNGIVQGNYALKRKMDINGWELIFIGQGEETALVLNANNDTNENYLITFIEGDIHGETSKNPSTIINRPNNSNSFHRMITIKYESDEKIIVTATVQWKTLFGIQETSVSRFFTNYLNTN